MLRRHKVIDDLDTAVKILDLMDKKTHSSAQDKWTTVYLLQK